MGVKDLARGADGRFLAASGVAATQGAGGGEGAPARGKAGRAGAPKPKAPRAKRVWTGEKERVFFRELGMLCNVSGALRKVGLLSQSRDVYDRKKNDAGFAARWEAAIRESYSLLELEMLERSRYAKCRGKPRTEVETRLREIPSPLALQLLKLHQGRKTLAAAAAAPASGAAAKTLRRAEAAALRREFDDMLDDLHRRLAARG